MTREEALKAIEYAKERAEVIREQGQSEYWAQEINWTIEALDMAIEALQKPPISQRSMYQAGYRQGREETLKQVTGKLNNSDNSLLTADSEACKEQKSKLDLISRAEAIEAVCDGCVWYKTASCEEGKEEWECSEVNKIRHLPSADRPRGEWTLLAEERPVDDYEIIATVYWPRDGDSIIAIGHIDRFDNWHLYSPTEGELIKGFEVIAWKTLPEPYKESDTE